VTASPAIEGTSTPSLRRRVTVTVLALIAALLLVVGVAVDLALEAQLRRDLHDRLVAATDRAVRLSEAGMSPEALAAELTGGGIRVRIVASNGASYGDPAIDPNTTAGPHPPPLPPPPRPGDPRPPRAPRPPPDATSTVVTQKLPTGARLILVADTTPITDVRRALRVVMFIAGAATLLLAALLLSAAVRGALRPLDRLTALAGRITSGDRGRRLRPDRTDTELGRAATAFDGMLDALEATEIRAQAAARDAQTAAEQARRAEAETRQFLSDAAHELRTPLAGIHAVAEQLAASHSTDTDPRQRWRSTLLMRETARTARLVNDMLDIARIDAGLPLVLETIDLGQLLDAELDRARILAPQLTVRRTGPASLPLRADAVRISQIVSNLLDNARRHTPPGGTITATLTAVGDQAELTITDTGPGVPDHERERIFHRLVRLSDARDRDSGGAGLGLPIAVGLARAHHGDLTYLPAQQRSASRTSGPRSAASGVRRRGGLSAARSARQRRTRRPGRAPVPGRAGPQPG
jgi:two-component system OmpR family sensor kinase